MKHMTKNMGRIFLLASLFVLNGFVRVQGERLAPPASPISPTLFGMHIHGMAVPRPKMKSPDPWPPISFGTWRLWDSYVDWPHLEPQPDKWDFANLDKYVSLAEEHQVEILLPLGMTPTWASLRPTERSEYGAGNAAPPKNLNDWKDYVRTVATRYRGRIHYYEIWNEPNLKSFFSGEPKDMVALTRAANEVLKQVDASIKIVSPSATGAPGVSWLDKFLQNGGGNFVDVIGFHLYVTPEAPEEMVPLAQSVRQVMHNYGISDRQLWDTESGWRIANRNSEVKPEGTGFSSKVLSEDEASAYVARCYVLLWASGVSRFYWYAWDNGVMGLTEADGSTLKPPATAYGEVENWLVGSHMTSCGTDDASTWTCSITREGGYKGWIVWNPNRNVNYSVSKEWKLQRVRNLNGQSRTLVNATSILVGSVPQLLENRSK